MELYQHYASIFEEYGFEKLSLLATYWNEPHRYYHNEHHLKMLLQSIEQAKRDFSEQVYKALVMLAFFHDVVYDPTQNNNEQKSADFFAQNTQEHAQKQAIYQAILDTQFHTPRSELSSIFSAMDMQIVSHGSFEQLLSWEKGIFKEYQYVDYQAYKTVRIHFLKDMLQKYPQNTDNLTKLIAYLGQYRPKIGIYAGSFNPFHNGHLNVLEKAEKVFDKIIIARGINPDKEDIDTGKLQLKVLKYRQFENFIGFLTDYVSSKEPFAEVTLVRGLRNGDDLDYEVNQLRFMEEMKPDLKIVFIPCDKQFEHISSSAIKNLEKINPDFGRKYLPQ